MLRARTLWVFLSATVAPAASLFLLGWDSTESLLGIVIAAALFVVLAAVERSRRRDRRIGAVPCDAPMSVEPRERAVWVMPQLTYEA